MATWENGWRASTVESGLPRRERRSGTFRSYLPDPLQATPLLLPPQVDALVARAEQAVRNLSGDSARDLAGIARFLLRSEAIASSRIEGITPAVQRITLAELVNANVLTVHHRRGVRYYQAFDVLDLVTVTEQRQRGQCEGPVRYEAW